MPFPKLNLHSEQYGKSGNIGENCRRLLGSPALTPLQTVIRESVQNILDAAKIGKSPEVLIRLRSLSPDELALLRENVFSELPRHKQSQEQLKQFLHSDTPTVLEICDFGTSGLGGPTRSDQIPAGTTQTDFIDFFRNIGSARDISHGGGTYGFGKVSLYAASRCSTILVDSFVHGNDPKYRRLMACHVGRSFSIECNGFMKRFTGRHWWGDMTAEDDFSEPLINEQADLVAQKLGLPSRDAESTGTSIMILDFDARTAEEGEEQSEVIGARIIETLLWNFWPRMMTSTPPTKRLTCRVEVNGIQLAVPRPENFPPLDLFTQAMDKLRGESDDGVITVVCQRPYQTLGKLAIKKGLRAKRFPLVENESLFPTTASHIAVMRPVELVVRYFQGDPFPDERLEWAGVFVVDNNDDVEQAFADAEPPAHDDWIPDNLPKGRAKTFVNVALREIRKAAQEVALARGRATTLSSEQGPSLAKLSGMIGSILDRGTGDGASKRSSFAKSDSKTSRRAKITRPVFTRLLYGYGKHDGPVAVFTADVIQDTANSGVAIRANAMFAAEGARLDTGDDSIERPEILELQFKGSIETISVTNTDLYVSGDSGTLEVYVAMPDDSAVTLDLQILRKGDA